MLAHDAARLMEAVERFPFPADTQECHATLDGFRNWLAGYRGELEAGAAKEVAAIEKARVRMNRISLCRPLWSAEATPPLSHASASSEARE